MHTGTFRGLWAAVIVAGFCTSAMGQPYTRCVTNFEAGENFVGGDVFTGEGAQVLWRGPAFSGSTAGIVPGDDPFGNLINDSQVFNCDGFDCLPTQGYEIRFAWEDPTNSNGLAGVRCTTLGTLNLPSPSVHLEGKVRFKMAVTAFEFLGTNAIPPFGNQIPSASILMCLGIRETGNNVAQGDPDTGGGDLEYVYLSGSEVIPAAGTNGLISFPPGGKRFAAASVWPPQASDYYSIEFDFATAAGLGLIRGFANNGDGTDTAGDGQLDATLNPSGGGVNRGVLESIIFTNDPADTSGAYFFIYIDEVEFESPVADGAIAAPVIAVPVNESDTTVVVNTKVNLCDDSQVDHAELFINDVSQGTAVPVDGEATFVGLSLSGGDVLKARQTKDGATSGFSLSVVVFGPGVIFADSFDTYTSQAELNQFWSNSINNPTPASARLNLITGGAASCENMIREFNPAGSDGARLYRYIGEQNGTDAEPLVVTWNFQHRNASSFGARTRFELARQASSTFSASAAARLKGTTGIILENGPGSVPLPQTLEEYNILLISSTGLPTAGSNGFFLGNQGNVANTGVARGDDEWHTMQIQVKSSTIDYYIDGVLANPVDTNGTPLWPGGVPRPSPDPYNFIIIGQGFSNNGPEMLFDNVSVTVGTNAIPFGPPNPVPSPTVVGPLFPNVTEVTVVDVDSNADSVSVYINGVFEVSTSGVGAFTDNTAVLTVGALVNGESVTATQTFGADESCLSSPVVVAVPSVTVETVLVPGQTTVEVSNLNEGVASAVTVYVDQGGGSTVQIGTVASPATDPVSVPVTALVDGNTIVATQTLGGVESPNSAGRVVAVPAPTIQPPVSVGDNLVTVTDVHPLATKVVVLVNGNTSGMEDVSTSGATTVVVSPLASPLFVDDEVSATQTIGGVTGPESAVLTVEVAMCFIAFEDSFETDTSANWNINVSDDAGGDDADAWFGWDFSTVGVPPSPRSPGSTRGLRFEANSRVAPGSPASVTVSPIGHSFTASTGYRLVFDAWVNANGPFPAGGTGSTESLTMGIGYDNVTVNRYVGTTAAGSGGWFAVTGEGGAARDYQAFKNAAEQFGESGQWLIGNTSASQNHPNPLFIGVFGGINVPLAVPDQTALFAQQTGTTLVGAAGFAWHKAQITVLGATAEWVLADLPMCRLSNNIGAQFPRDGNISLGYMDVFASVTDNPNLSFGLVDNVKVLVPHTPGVNGDFDGNSVVNLADYRYFGDCLNGVGETPSPSSGAGCNNICLDVFDFDADGDVDLADYRQFQLLFP